MASDPKKLFKRALGLTKKGQIDKAIEAYQEILKKSPEDPRVINNLGDLYLKKNMTNQAVDAYSKLAKIYDEDGYALRAIAICQKVLKVQPEAVGVRARMAGLYTRQGLVVEARNQYLTLADHYDKEGKVKEALEIFRKMADLDPYNLSVRVKLGNMFQKEGMVEKAAGEWVTAAEGYAKKGQPEETLKLLNQAIEAHPGNVRARILMAAEKIRNDDYNQAIVLLQPVVSEDTATAETLKLYAASLLKTQRYEEAAEGLKRALELEPSSKAIQENLGLALLKSGQVEEGSGYLRKAIENYAKDNRWDKAEKLATELHGIMPEDPAILQKLVEVYTHSENRSALVATYQDLAGIYERKGLKKNVLGICEKLLQLIPGNQDLIQKISRLRDSLKVKGPEKPLPKLEEVVEAGEGELESPVDELEVIAVAEEEAVSLAEEEIIVSTSPMAAVENYLKQGLLDKAEIKLKKIVEEEPAIDNMRMLKEVYHLQGKKKDFIGVCFEIAGFLEKAGRRSESLSEFQDILKVDGNNREAKEMLADLVVSLGPEILEEKPAEAVEEEMIVSREPAVVVEETVEIAEEPLVEMEEMEIDLAEMDLEKVAEEVAGVQIEETTVTVTEEKEEDFTAGPSMEIDLEQLADAELDTEELVSSVEELARKLETEIPAGSLNERVAEEAFEAVEEERAEPPAEAEKEKAEDIEELVTEANFYFQQGLFNEAMKLYRHIQTIEPGRQDVGARLEQIEAQKIATTAAGDLLSIREDDLKLFEESLEVDLPTGAPAARFTVAPEKEMIEAPVETSRLSDLISDIKEEMEGIGEPGPVTSLEDEGLQEIFQEFKQGVKEQLPDEDYETHYNLGIAYKEMGLMDEAIMAFEMASKSKELAVDAVSMMALCFKDKGNLGKAIAALEHAISETESDEDGRKGLMWELAGILEEKGDLARAADLYLSVQEIDPEYHGVEKKVRQLSARTGGKESDKDKESKEEETGQKEPSGNKSTKVSYL